MLFFLFLLFIPLIFATTRPYILFGTTNTYDGSFSFNSGIDTVCQAEAVSRVYSGGTVYFYGYNITARLALIPARSSAPIYGPNYSILIANNFTQLRTGTLESSLGDAGVCALNATVWTALTNAENAGTGTCSVFTDTTANGANTALCNTVVSTWETSGPSPTSCTVSLYLLCLWDPPITSSPSHTPSNIPSRTPSRTPTTSSPSKAPTPPSMAPTQSPTLPYVLFSSPPINGTLGIERMNQLCQETALGLGLIAGQSYCYAAGRTFNLTRNRAFVGPTGIEVAPDLNTFQNGNLEVTLSAAGVCTSGFWSGMNSAAETNEARCDDYAYTFIRSDPWSITNFNVPENGQLGSCLTTLDTFELAGGAPDCLTTHPLLCVFDRQVTSIPTSVPTKSPTSRPTTSPTSPTTPPPPSVDVGLIIAVSVVGGVCCAILLGLSTYYFCGIRKLCRG